MKAIVSDELRTKCPLFIGCLIEADVCNAPTPETLWSEIETAMQALQRSFDSTTIKQRSGIAATRTAYKLCGKDPSRYRPACEQLARRVLQGKGLYSIDTLVDAGNLVSLASGYTVAVLDADRIAGNTLTLGIGRAEEPYEAIGRGPLNIEGMPVYRDAEGGVATPTSDHVRTQVSAATRRAVILINGYDGSRPDLETAAALACRLLTTYAAAPPSVVAYF